MKKIVFSAAFLVVFVAIASLNLPMAQQEPPSMTESTDAVGSNPIVIIETTMGTIKAELDAKNAPNTTANFLQYVEDGYFVDTTFHRVIKGFMIQGGGITADMRDKPSKHAPIKNEANNGLKNDKYTLAMARTNDPHSATSQFFINVKDNGFLNFSEESMRGWGYAVFGKVVEGQAVVDAIEGVKTTSKGGHQDVPVEPVTITAVSVAE